MIIQNRVNRKIIKIQNIEHKIMNTIKLRKLKAVKKKQKMQETKVLKYKIVKIQNYEKKRKNCGITKLLKKNIYSECTIV